MKYTFFITQRCNLACDYCYVQKRPARMSRYVAKQGVDFAFARTPAEEKLEVGFFGGEPLLEFDRVRDVTDIIEDHTHYAPERVELTVVSNGTVFSPTIATFLKDHRITLGISCDGPPRVQDAHRRFANGRTSSAQVEETVRAALAEGVPPLVNAVYGPDTVSSLPETVAYFSSLGLRQIYLNPDFTANWSEADVRRLRASYASVAAFYMDCYRRGDRHFISLLDSKITVILRGGYQPLERCRMGRGEFAFTPEGRIYPCERLVGDGSGGDHCIGDLEHGLDFSRLACRAKPGASVNEACLTCGIRSHCMNWCGCSNYFASGYYNRVNAFLCASERASVEVAFEALQTLEKELGPTFHDHLGGDCQLCSVGPGERSEA